MPAFTATTLHHLRQHVKSVIGRSNPEIILCANQHFSACDLVDLAHSLSVFAPANGFQWEFIRWKFALKRLNGMVLTIRYKAQAPGKTLFARRFTLERGQLVANHDYLVLPKKLQGANLSRILNGIMYQMYNQLAITKVKVYAGFDGGGYAWAKAGFAATVKKEVYHILKQARAKIDNGSTNLLTHALLDSFEEYADNHYARNPNQYFPIYLWGNAPEGRELLAGTDWHGELNLAEGPQRTIFEIYLSKR